MTLETIIAFPILVIVLVAAVQFSSTMIVHHAVMAAAVEASREGSKVPTDMGTDAARIVTAVEETVTEVLSTTHNLSAVPASGVMVIVEDSMGVDCGGDTTVVACPAGTSVVDPAVVRVTVLVEMDDARIPNLLETFGWSTNGRRFEICSDSRRDCI